MEPHLALRLILLPESCAGCMMCCQPREVPQPGTAELFVLHSIVNLHLEERLEVMAKRHPNLLMKQTKAFYHDISKTETHHQTQEGSRGKIEMIRGMWGASL